MAALGSIFTQPQIIVAVQAVLYKCSAVSPSYERETDAIGRRRHLSALSHFYKRSLRLLSAFSSLPGTEFSGTFPQNIGNDQLRGRLAASWKQSTRHRV